MFHLTSPLSSGRHPKSSKNTSNQWITTRPIAPGIPETTPDSHPPSPDPLVTTGLAPIPPHLAATITPRETAMTTPMTAPLTTVILFVKAQARQASRLAQFASVDTHTASPSVVPPTYGMGPSLDANAARKAASSTQMVFLSVQTGRSWAAVPVPPMTSVMNAPVAENRLMVLNNALLQRRSRAHTPFIAETWQTALSVSGLINRYPTLPSAILNGFDAGIRPITFTYAPLNSPSISQLASVFEDIVQIEFAKGRYIGPFSRQEVEDVIGPFQTSPLSLVEKPGKPNQFRLIQNLSFPHKPRPPIYSINHNIDSDLYPCTWGTFTTICLLVWRLPPGSQGACRDVAEAFRTIPLAPSQWPGTVVHLSDDDQFTINTSNSFGLCSAGGIYGVIGDAAVDLLRSHGIGPISKWVDDHFFIRILRKYLPVYNAHRRVQAKRIISLGGRHHDRGRYWYGGDLLPDNRTEEFDKDMSFPIVDLSHSSERSPDDRRFTYSFTDINQFTDKLGLPWESSKDVPFSSVTPFTGLNWDLDNKTVSLQKKKQEKYLAAILLWQSQRSHKLDEVQKLYRKLLHACLVLPRGRAHLMSLEAMLGIFHDAPEKPRTPPASVAADLLWWYRILSQPTISRPIPGPCELLDIHAFSDASSSVGIGIVIGKRWRAWRLVPGWKSTGRDIGWAKAIGFEFLIKTVLRLSTQPDNFKVYRDNNGIIQGWWKGC